MQDIEVSFNQSNIHLVANKVLKPRIYLRIKCNCWRMSNKQWHCSSLCNCQYIFGKLLMSLDRMFVDINGCTIVGIKHNLIGIMRMLHNCCMMNMGKGMECTWNCLMQSTQQNMILHIESFAISLMPLNMMCIDLLKFRSISSMMGRIQLCNCWLARILGHMILL